MPVRPTSRMRFARVMLKVQLAGMAVGAVALVYILGFGVHPHQVGNACLIAACYVAFTGVVTYFTQQLWRAQARRAAGAAHHADGVVPTRSSGGLDAAGVRKAFRSQRRVWLSVTLLGVAMLIAFAVLVDHYQSPATQSSSVSVQGVITRVTGQGAAPFNGAVEVQYAYAGQSFDARVYRDDNSPVYHVGQAVTVTLDPSDPQVATVGGSDNQSPGLVWLLIVLLLGGGLAVILGLAMIAGMLVSRRKARMATVTLTPGADTATGHQ